MIDVLKVFGIVAGVTVLFFGISLALVEPSWASLAGSAAIAAAVCLGPKS